MYSLSDAVELVESLALESNIPIDPIFVANNLYIQKHKLFFKVKEYLNVSVNYDSDVDFISCVFKNTTSNAYFITVNEKFDEIAQRFAIAHCVGHILLGHLEDGEVKTQKKFPIECDEQDGDASIVASHLLFPTSMVESAIRIGRYDVNYMARIFDVSTTLVHFRLKEESYL